MLTDRIFDRRMATVVRWHHRPTRTVETLAEHTYFVMRNAAVVCEALQRYDIAAPEMPLVLGYAMLHDEAEVIVGDVSGEAKATYPALKTLLSNIESDIIDGPLFANLPDGMREDYQQTAHEAHDLSLLEAQIVKYVDRIEAWQFALNEWNHGNADMGKMVHGLHEDVKVMEWPWLVKLREKGQGFP